MTPQHLTLMMGVCIVWALTLVTAKIGLVDFPPFLFSGLRFLLVSLVLCPFARIFHGRMWTIFAIAMTAGGFQFAILYIGMQMTEDVSAVALAVQLGMPFSTLLSIIILKEQVKWRRWLGISLSFLGVMVVSFDPRVLAYLGGFSLGILAAFIGAFSSVLMKQLEDVGVFDLQFWIATFSWPMLFILSLVLEGNPIPVIAQATMSGWGTILFAAFCSSCFAHAGMYYLLQRYDVTVVSPLTLITTPIAVGVSVLFLGDVLTLRMALGGFVTLVGVAIISLRQPDYTIEGKQL